MSIINCQFIIYACPVGKLNRQIENYLQKSLSLCGENKAHKYMPHCTLTGFFNDDIGSLNYYLEALGKAYLEAKNNLDLSIAIEQLTFNDNWHGLELQAEGLKQLIANFAEREKSPTSTEKLRLKDWLHLSLAYDFNPEDRERLQNLAIENIDLQADVNWELRFYQKNSDWTWKCLGQWTINN